MTDAESRRHRAIKALIAKSTAANTVSQEVARETLIKEGIYTEKGQLSAEFGGPCKKGKSAA